MQRIDRQVKQILELVKESEGERSYRGTERLVQLVIQALLDLGLMVITVLGGRTPTRYSEVGELLSDLGLLDGCDAKLLKSMAGMRNILVHAYRTVDKDLVIDASKSLREDASRIARTITAGLEGRNIDPQPPPVEIAEKLGKILIDRVKIALLFGGRAKGYSMKGDYDIAIYFGREHSLYDMGELLVDIARVLGVEEEDIDLLCLDSTTPEMVLEAVEGKILYLEDINTLFEVKLKALMEMLDIQSGIQAIK